MKAKVFDIKGKELDAVTLNEELFGAPVNEHVLYEYIKMYLGNQRLGTVNVKTRSEVTASGKKIYRQKGTGNARHGAVSANLFRKGGKSHGPKPKSYYKSIRKALKENAMVSALSQRASEEAIVVIDGFEMEAISTRFANDVLRSHVEKTALLIVEEPSEVNSIIYKSVRNLPYMEIKTIQEVNAYDIMKSKTLILKREVLDAIQNEEVESESV